MNKATFVLLVTSQLLNHAALEPVRWADVEQTFGVQSCWQKISLDLDEACLQKGVSDLETVDFAACKMGCKNHTIQRIVITTYDMPNGTPCGYLGETCQNGKCVGNCDLLAPHGCIRRPTTEHSSQP
uniref:Putative ixostatin n=1 Tax=Ixodes ricinus TaxID=34613 RepID=A0A0K8RIW3_IXORI